MQIIIEIKNLCKIFKDSAQEVCAVNNLRVLVITIFLCVTQFSFTKAQEITEENYLKIDSAIWVQYEQEIEKISEHYKKYPEKKDSLIAATDHVYNVASKKNIEAAIKYASVPSGLQRLYMVRLDIPKDTIYAILKTLPDSMQTSPYGKSLLYHIESEQISEGNKYYDFQAIDTEGKIFTLSSLEGKNILLLYGGLSCMGETGRNYLNKVYSETSRDNFEIVVYCPNSNLENLQQVRTTYPCNFFLVSDFLQDHTPMKILYGAQAMPTCFFINQEGVMIMKTVGLDEIQVDQLLKEQY
jgi:peroxiredoxin